MASGPTWVCRIAPPCHSGSRRRRVDQIDGQPNPASDLCSAQQDHAVDLLRWWIAHSSAITSPSDSPRSCAAADPSSREPSVVSRPHAGSCSAENPGPSPAGDRGCARRRSITAITNYLSGGSKSCPPDCPIEDNAVAQRAGIMDRVVRARAKLALGSTRYDVGRPSRPRMEIRIVTAGRGVRRTRPQTASG